MLVAKTREIRFVPAPQGYACVGLCVFTGREYRTTGVITGRMVGAFQAGAHVQDAFPDLSADDREFILSGISPTGWESLAPADDE